MNGPAALPALVLAPNTGIDAEKEGAAAVLVPGAVAGGAAAAVALPLPVLSVAVAVAVALRITEAACAIACDCCCRKPGANQPPLVSALGLVAFTPPLAPALLGFAAAPLLPKEKLPGALPPLWLLAAVAAAVAAAAGATGVPLMPNTLARLALGYASPNAGPMPDQSTAGTPKSGVLAARGASAATGPPLLFAFTGVAFFAFSASC